jgi:hypothetical protein
MISEDDKALVATITFFRALRREWARYAKGPGREAGADCPIPNWEDIGGMDRVKFTRSMKSALASASPDNVLKVIENAKAL